MVEFYKIKFCTRLLGYSHSHRLRYKRQRVGMKVNLIMVHITSETDLPAAITNTCSILCFLRMSIGDGVSVNSMGIRMMISQAQW
jgi:hypothetical protein